MTSNIILQLNTCCYNPYVTYIHSDERMGLSFTVAAILASTVILMFESRRIHDYILVPQIRGTLQPRGLGPRIYIPQEHGGPFIPSGTGFPFGCLLRLTGLRWRYSTPFSHGMTWQLTGSESESELLYEWRFTPISSFWRQAPWDSRPAFFNWILAFIVLM
jgi:hypothetical protein